MTVYNYNDGYNTYELNQSVKIQKILAYPHQRADYCQNLKNHQKADNANLTEKKF